MFYGTLLFTKSADNAALAPVWLAAHWPNKLKKEQIVKLVIHAYIEKIRDPSLPLALRLRSHLLCGLARIYQKKVHYLYDDALLVKKDTIARHQPVVGAGVLPGSAAEGAAAAVDLSTSDLVAPSVAITSAPTGAANLEVMDISRGLAMGGGALLENTSALLDSLATTEAFGAGRPSTEGDFLARFSGMGGLTGLGGLGGLGGLEAGFDGLQGLDESLALLQRSVGMSIAQAEAAVGLGLDQLSTSFADVEFGRAAAEARRSVGGSFAQFDHGLGPEAAVDVTLGGVELPRGEMGGKDQLAWGDMSLGFDASRLGLSMGELDQTHMGEGARPGEETISDLLFEDPTAIQVSKAAAEAKRAASVVARKRKQLEAARVQDPETELSTEYMTKMLQDPSGTLLKRRTLLPLPTHRIRSMELTRRVLVDSNTAMSMSTLTYSDPLVSSALIGQPLAYLPGSFQLPDFPPPPPEGEQRPQALRAAAEEAPRAGEDIELDRSMGGWDQQFVIEDASMIAAQEAEASRFSLGKSFALDLETTGVASIPMEEAKADEGAPGLSAEPLPSPLPAHALGADDAEILALREANAGFAGTQTLPSWLAKARGDATNFVALLEKFLESRGLGKRSIEAREDKRRREGASAAQLAAESIEMNIARSKAAALGFVSLLHALTANRVEAEQEEPYGEITVRVIKQ